MRTQAERDADDHTWRHTANGRPGYATWPHTQPGNPSWWARHGQQSPAHPAPSLRLVRPVEGETCAKWCGFCHLNASESQPAAQPDNAPITEDFGPVPAAPRRRWWHRYTRTA